MFILKCDLLDTVCVISDPCHVSIFGYIYECYNAEFYICACMVIDISYSKLMLLFVCVSTTFCIVCPASFLVQSTDEPYV